MLSAHELKQQQKFENFKNSISKVPPADCEFKAGDFVTFTNEFGVFFRKPKEVIGFNRTPELLPQRTIYTNSDAWWFPSKESELQKVEYTPTGCFIVRELFPFSSDRFEDSLLDDDKNWYRLESENNLHIVWANDVENELVTFCESDIIWTTARDSGMYCDEIRRTINFFCNL